MCAYFHLGYSVFRTVLLVQEESAEREHVKTPRPTQIPTQNRMCECHEGIKRDSEAATYLTIVIVFLCSPHVQLFVLCQSVD